MENYDNEYEDRSFTMFCIIVMIALIVGFIVGSGFASYYNW